MRNKPSFHRKPDCSLVGWLTLLAISILSSHLFSAVAATNRVGVISANYTMTASGSGDNYWSGFDGLNITSEHDQVQVAISGQVQYEVWQTETNRIIGSLVSSSAQQSASGTGQLYAWDDITPPPVSETDDYIYVADPNFSSTNYCVTLTASPGVSSQFLGTSEMAVFGYGFGGAWGPCDWAWGEVWPPDPIADDAGAACTWHAMAEARHFQFAITNSAMHWTQTLATNTVVNYSFISSDGDPVIGHFTGAATAANTVTLEYIPDQPTVVFTADPTNGLVPLRVQFTSASVDSGNNVITNWTWTFGDGTNGSGQSPAHTYTNTGKYFVRLFATNVNGTAVQGIGSSNITVALPTVQFSVMPTNGFESLAVFFTCPHVDSGGNAIVSWNWNFGDGTTFEDQSPNQPETVTHIYTNAQTFSPKLTVTNIWGTKISTNGPKVEVWPPPIFYTATPSNGLVPMPVRFAGPDVDGKGYKITNWNWNFGDGSMGSGQTPMHTYTHANLYAPSLVAMNKRGSNITAFGPRIMAGCALVFGGSRDGVGYDSNGNTTNSAGIHPKAALTGASNRLYGVMSGGGTGGSGTVFAVNPDGSGFTNLHSFSPTPIGWYTNYDGATPKARLELSGNTLYGAASSGGPKGMGSGTLFKLNTDGSGFATLFNFPDDSNGGTGPNGLVLAGGMLYGTTAYGGQAYGGTVFKIAPNGSGFTRMHEFSASAYNPSIGSMTNSDGAYPQAALVVSGTTLYGTASGCGSNGCGTVFKINTDGSGFAVLHHFTASEGSSPSGELFLSGDLMYGTAESGGSAYAGTVFQIGMDGTRFSRLLAFPSTVYNGAGNYTNSSGAAPYGALLLSGGMLYGTTESGGSAGSGTIFAVNTNGSGFTNLYTFSGFDLSTRTNLDGANPYAGLALSDSTVYATTYNGGDAGYGSLFALNLLAAPPQVQIQCNGTAMVFTWPSSAMGFVLQKNPGLIPANWAPIGLSVTDDGTTRSVTIAAPLGNLFFRLAKP